MDRYFFILTTIDLFVLGFMCLLTRLSESLNKKQKRGFLLAFALIACISVLEVITIVVDGDEYVVEQVEKQLNKVIPVIKVKTLEEGAYIPRTLSLIKVAVAAGQRADIMRITELMSARIVDVTRTSMTVEFADTPERTETLETLLRPYGIKEVVRTGVIAIEKGADPTRKVDKAEK